MPAGRWRAVLFGIALLLAATAADAQSTARTVRVQSREIGLRAVAVLLPADYEQSSARYPVLYLLHGGGQDQTAFMARRDFARRARTVDMIVVMPAADRGGIPPTMTTRYEDFLAIELVAYIDANFRTIAAAPSRAIAGLSMGGMFAVGTALRYPRLFGTVGAFSPAAPRTEAPPPDPGADVFFYVSCGTLDSQHEIAHQYHAIPGFAHSWDFWDPQLDVFFRVLARRW
jgi:S-formylglutathione hydrolase FrmB